MGGRASAWAIRQASAERMEGRAADRAGGRVNGRARGRAGGRSAGRSAGTFWYTISGFSSKFVIISRADGLKRRGELKSFLIPGEFNNVGNIKV